MKTLSLLLVLAFLPLLFISCSDEEGQSAEKQQIQFTFDIASPESNSGRASTEFPAGAILSVTITKDGTTTSQNFELALLKMGDGVITEPLEIVPGRYAISDFVVRVGSEIIYATPKRGSPLAPAVEHSLPYNFSVGKNGISNVRMQVVNTAGNEPSAFGYVAFDIDLINPLAITVMELTDNGYTFVDAEARILFYGTLVDSTLLKAKANIISFDNDPQETYTLEIRKKGFNTYSREFTYSSLMGDLNGKPLVVVLVRKALEIRIQVQGNEEEFSFGLGGTGQVTLSGAGPYSGTYTLPIQYENFVLPPGVHDIKVTGDLDQLEGLNSFGYNTGILYVTGFEYLPALKHFAPGMYYNAPLDFSVNSKLEHVDLAMVQVPSIVLPDDHNISTFLLMTYPRPDVYVVDYIVGNIAQNAINKSITNGRLHLSLTEDPSSDVTKMWLEYLHDLGWAATAEQ
jgi:hypothetical protein